MAAYVLTGYPFGSKELCVIGVYRHVETAESASREYDELGYSGLEVDEVEYHEH